MALLLPDIDIYMRYREAGGRIHSASNISSASIAVASAMMLA